MNENVKKQPDVLDLSLYLDKHHSDPRPILHPGFVETNRPTNQPANQNRLGGVSLPVSPGKFLDFLNSSVPRAENCFIVTLKQRFKPNLLNHRYVRA